MRRWLPVVALALAAIHYVSIAATSALAAELSIPVLIALVVFGREARRRPRRILALLPRVTSVVLILSLLLDLLVNTSAFEPGRTGRMAFQGLLKVSLILTPMVAVLMPRRFQRWLPVFAVLLVLLPPVAFTAIPRMLSPSYGFAVILIGATNLLAAGFRPLHPRGILRVYSAALLLVPLSFLSLPWTLAPIAPLQNAMELVLLFGVGALLLPVFRGRAFSARLLPLAPWLLLPWMAFLLAFPAFHALNSNISSVLMEWGIFIVAAQAVQNRRMRWIAVSIMLVAYLTIVRIDSRSAMVAAPVGLVFVGLFFSLNGPRGREVIRSERARSLLFAGLFLGALLLLLGALFLSGAYSIEIRRLLWRLALTAQLESPRTALVGTGNFGYFFYLFRIVSAPLTPIEAEVLSREPVAVTHNPHSDYVLMLYGGGIFYLATFLFFVWQTIRSSVRSGQAEHVPLRVGAITTLLVHSLTEPLTSTLSTSFLFWMTAGSLRSGSTSFVRVGRRGAAWISGAAILFSSMAVVSEANRIPVQVFWNAHASYITIMRNSPDDLLVNEILSHRQSIERAVRSLDRAAFLSPMDTDVYRQRGDLLFFLGHADSAQDARRQSLNGSLDSYCTAFTRAPIPAHYAGIRRVLAELPERDGDPCPNFSPERKSVFRAFDPVGHIRSHPF